MQTPPLIATNCYNVTYEPNKTAKQVLRSTLGNSRVNTLKECAVYSPFLIEMLYKAVEMTLNIVKNPDGENLLSEKIIFEVFEILTDESLNEYEKKIEVSALITYLLLPIYSLEIQEKKQPDHKWDCFENSLQSWLLNPCKKPSLEPMELVVYKKFTFFDSVDWEQNHKDIHKRFVFEMLFSQVLNRNIFENVSKDIPAIIDRTLELNKKD